jgi:hypothetical protein
MKFNIKVSTGEGGRLVDDGIGPGLVPATIKSIEPGQAKAYKSEELEDIIWFVFDTGNGEARYKVRQTFCPKPPSNLFKVIKALNPGAIASGQMDTASAVEDVVVKLQGRKCMINLEEVDGRSGPYCKVTSVMAQAGSAGQKQEVLVDTNVDDDDIPF